MTEVADPEIRDGYEPELAGIIIPHFPDGAVLGDAEERLDSLVARLSELTDWDRTELAGFIDCRGTEPAETQALSDEELAQSVTALDRIVNMVERFGPKEDDQAEKLAADEVDALELRRSYRDGLSLVVEILRQLDGDPLAASRILSELRGKVERTVQEDHLGEASHVVRLATAIALDPDSVWESDGKRYARLLNGDVVELHSIEELRARLEEIGDKSEQTRSTESDDDGIADDSN